jgi:hypothetical protein
MSLADNKRSVFTTIGSYNSLMEQGNAPRQTDLYPSINNKNDTVPFLLDVLKTVAGSDALIETIGGMFGNLVDEVEPKLKTTLKKQFIQSNANEPLPISFVNNGITVPVKTIDSKGKLKINPNSDTGNLIYGEPANSFDGIAYDAISNAGSTKGYGNMAIKYIATTDSFQIKPSGTTTNIGDYFTDYINDTQLVNKKELISAVTDNFYGTLASNQGKTVEQLYNELQAETLLQQVLDDDDSFVILPEKYDELLAKARELAVGEVNYDLGCGLMPAELDLIDFSTLVSTISGSTDPFFIGNQIGATIDQSTTTTENTTKENKQTIKDGFFQKIIRIFTVKMLEAVIIAPQIRVLFGMMSSLQNNGVVELNDPAKDMKYFKTCIKCMAKEIMKAIAEFIFALAIVYLIKLLKPVIKRVVKEKINQYVGIIKSLTGANKLMA